MGSNCQRGLCNWFKYEEGIIYGVIRVRVRNGTAREGQDAQGWAEEMWNGWVEVVGEVSVQRER